MPRSRVPNRYQQKGGHGAKAQQGTCPEPCSSSQVGALFWLPGAQSSLPRMPQTGCSLDSAALGSNLSDRQICGCSVQSRSKEGDFLASPGPTTPRSRTRGQNRLCLPTLLPLPAIGAASICLGMPFRGLTQSPDPGALAAGEDRSHRQWEEWDWATCSSLGRAETTASRLSLSSHCPEP